MTAEHKIEFKVLDSSLEDSEDFSLALARLLHEAVQEGASMGYLLETPIGQLQAFWTGVLAKIAKGSGKLVFALENGALVGAVFLSFEENPNASHRAEVKKLLVAREHRGQGIAKKLLSIVEMEARISKRTLLVLDTETDSLADYLYQTLGWTLLGTMPNHSALPNGELRPTSYYYKEIDA